MPKRNAKGEKGWYRRNWKAVVTVWGILLGLFAIMGTVLWFVVFRQKHDSPVTPSHVHRSTRLEVVAPSPKYVLTTCVVSGKPLRPFPDRVAVVCEGVEVQFCCENCIEAFEKEPGRFLAVVRKAAK